MDKAMRSFKLLRLPWDHEKLEKVIDIEEVKYKTYFIQVWLTMMFLITLSFIVWCCFYVWKAEKKRGKLLRNQKHAKAVASLFKIWELLKSFTVHSTQVMGLLLWTDTKNTVPYKRNSFLWSHATFHRWMLRLLERFAAQDPSQKRYWLGVKRDLL